MVTFTEEILNGKLHFLCSGKRAKISHLKPWKRVFKGGSYATTDERTTTTYALLDNGNQSTLIRDDCAQGSKLKGYKKTVSVSSVIDKVWGVTSEENSKGRNISDASTRLWNNRLCNCAKFAVKKEARGNLLKSVTSEQEAVSLIKEMVDLLKAGEFVSTDENVMKTIAETEKAKSL